LIQNPRASLEVLPAYSKIFDVNNFRKILEKLPTLFWIFLSLFTCVYIHDIFVWKKPTKNRTTKAEQKKTTRKKRKTTRRETSPLYILLQQMVNKGISFYVIKCENLLEKPGILYI
jgi:hypothetical protein